MQRLEQGLAQSGQWFRLGILSATMVTPLLSRWRELRAAERARDLWEARRTGARWPWTPAEVELPSLARRSNVSARLWLAGVGVGLLAAGTTAYLIARRRLRAMEEAPLELPLVGANGRPRQMGQQERALFGGSTQPSGDRATAPERASDQYVDGPARSGAPLRPGGVTPEQREETAAGTMPLDGAPAGVVDAEAAPFVGNIRTMVYRETDAENLPAEEIRIYFASAEEAEAAGYHFDRSEVAGTGSE